MSKDNWNVFFIHLPEYIQTKIVRNVELQEKRRAEKHHQFKVDLEAKQQSNLIEKDKYIEYLKIYNNEFTWGVQTTNRYFY